VVLACFRRTEYETFLPVDASSQHFSSIMMSFDYAESTQVFRKNTYVFLYSFHGFWISFVKLSVICSYKVDRSAEDDDLILM